MLCCSTLNQQADLQRCWSQAWFLQEGVLRHALPLLADEDEMCRLKGLLLASCMIRGCAQALVHFCDQLQGIQRAVSLVRLFV